MDVSSWADIATIIAAVIAVITLPYVARQVKLAKLASEDTAKQAELAKRASEAAAYQVELAEKTSRGQLWLQLRQLFTHYDEAHIKLRPNGEWYASDSKPTDKDLPKVELYLGIFEHCERLLEEGLIDQATFESNYIYRLRNIVVNKRIRKTKLIGLWSGWKDFLRLLYRFRHEIKKKVSEKQDPDLWKFISLAVEEKHPELHKRSGGGKQADL